MLTEPALYEALLDKVFEFRYECFARLLDACGDAMPIFDTGDDFATQRGLMISPEHWRRFLKPRYAGIFELGMSRGKVVWFHSCGDISAVLSDLIDIGMNVWETVQLHTLPMSPEVFKREYGRHLTFFGGINTQQLPFATPGQIREEVVRCIEVLGEGGGYICGPDHHIKPDVPGENAVALYDAARSFRRPHYTL
jgi:uroporphyrinogen decarboxylase